MNAVQEHHIEWNDRLQDWLDGEPDATFEAHLAACQLCQTRLEDLQSLEESLHGELPPLSLDATFDARLYAQIGEIDERQKQAARERVEREWQENLSALRSSWRRSLAFVIPGIVAGIALAFALAAWLDSSGVVQTVAAESLKELGRSDSHAIQMYLTGLLGATIGLVVARWLASVTD
jgi:anti-sigma factor RsiW